MSDISDVENVLVQLIGDTLYPVAQTFDNGKTFDAGRYDLEENPALLAAQPKYDGSVPWDSGKAYDVPSGISITNTPIVIYPGWPSSANLAQDLANGKTHVTVFPKAEERNTTRYRRNDIVTIPPQPTLSITVVASMGKGQKWDQGGNWDQGQYDIPQSTKIVIGGAPSSPQNIALLINGKFYVYAVQGSDTIANIGAGLLALVQVLFPAATFSVDTLTMPWNARVQAARVGGVGTVSREIRRQERLVMISVWTNSPALRDQVSSAIDVALAERTFLTMPDGYGAHIRYKNSLVIDQLEKTSIYRRDLNYLIEYATTSTKQLAAVIAPSYAFNGTTTNF